MSKSSRRASLPPSPHTPCSSAGVRVLLQHLSTTAPGGESTLRGLPGCIQISRFTSEWMSVTYGLKGILTPKKITLSQSRSPHSSLPYTLHINVMCTKLYCIRVRLWKASGYFVFIQDVAFSCGLCCASVFSFKCSSALCRTVSIKMLLCW